MNRCELIVLGEGEILDEFLRLYAEKINIAFLLNESNWRAGTIYKGYEVENVEILNEIDIKNYNYVICSSIFRETEKLLQQNDIEEYYIFLGTKKFKDAINWE